MIGDDDPLGDARWFADALNIESGFVEFVRTNREEIAAPPFLDERYFGRNGPRRRVSLNEVMRAAPEPAAPGHYVFHTAFCCSTLLARLLDHPGTNLSLKEPKVLLDLTAAGGSSLYKHDRPAAWRELAKAVFNLLARRLTREESILVKPSNAANGLMPDILAHGGRALLLYCDLRSFLVSVIKNGRSHRRFVRHLFTYFQAHSDSVDIICPEDRDYSDLEVAALVWRHQIENFRKVLQGTHQSRMRTLDCAEFLDQPEGTLAALSTFFGLDLGPDRIRDTVNGPVFARHSKYPFREYSAGQRSRENHEVEVRYGDALRAILEWAGAAGPIPAALPNALEVSEQ